MHNIIINYGTCCCFVALTLPNLPQDIVSLDLVASHYGENYVMQNILYLIAAYRVTSNRFDVRCCRNKIYFTNRTGITMAVANSKTLRSYVTRNSVPGSKPE